MKKGHVEVLYSSKMIRNRLQEILGNPSLKDRRVALVAYVGESAQAYLPNPSGLLLICNPTPGGTSARALRSLLSAGAIIKVSKKLHMKVYWSKERGCIITSANASTNALGIGGLKEAGAYFPPGVVDIDALLDYASPGDLTLAGLRKLQLDTRALPPHMRPKTDRYGQSPDFLAWYNSKKRESDPWKFGWWEDPSLTAAKTAKAKSKTQYGVVEPKELINVGRGQVKSNDWLLTFEISEGKKIKGLQWMFVDFAVPVDPSDKKAYEKEFPCQAVQVHSRAKYPSPPFKITVEFRKAFNDTAIEYGLDRIKKMQNLVPPSKMLLKIAQKILHK